MLATRSNGDTIFAVPRRSRATHDGGMMDQVQVSVKVLTVGMEQTESNCDKCKTDIKRVDNV